MCGFKDIFFFFYLKMLGLYFLIWEYYEKIIYMYVG